MVSVLSLRNSHREAQLSILGLDKIVQFLSTRVAPSGTPAQSCGDHRERSFQKPVLPSNKGQAPKTWRHLPEAIVRLWRAHDFLFILLPVGISRNIHEMRPVSTMTPHEHHEGDRMPQPGIWGGSRGLCRPFQPTELSMCTPMGRFGGLGLLSPTWEQTGSKAAAGHSKTIVTSPWQTEFQGGQYGWCIHSQRF